MAREDGVTPPLSIGERFPKLKEIPQGSFPQHFLIIPDGNRRYARAHRVETVLGHKSGMEKTLALIGDLNQLPIPMITFWVFSCDNWKRPTAENAAFFVMLERGIREHLGEIQSANIKLRRIGRTDRIPVKLRDALEYAVKQTKENSGKIVNLAVDFSGDDQELRSAERLMALARSKTKLKATPELLAYLRDGAGSIPPADLLMRTGGEHRTSGIGWLEGSPTELHFTDKLYPEIETEDIILAIQAFAKRTRRMGA